MGTSAEDFNGAFTRILIEVPVVYRRIRQMDMRLFFFCCCFEFEAALAQPSQCISTIFLIAWYPAKCKIFADDTKLYVAHTSNSISPLSLQCSVGKCLSQIWQLNIVLRVSILSCLYSLYVERVVLFRRAMVTNSYTKRHLFSKVPALYTDSTMNTKAQSKYALLV